MEFWRIVSRVNKDVIERLAYTFELLQDARVQILVHVAILQSIMGGFLGRVDRSIEMLQLRGEAHTDLERIRHNAHENNITARPMIKSQEYEA